MNTTLRSIIAIVGLVSVGMTAALLPSAANAASAQQFMTGGQYCFSVGTSIPGGWQTTLHMVVDRARGRPPFKVAHIDAVEHGIQATHPEHIYSTPLTGSATIASQLSDEKQLQISLSGSNFGAELVGGTTGIWISNQALTLNLTDLTGHDTGYKTFTTIQAGQPGEPNKYAIDESIAPIPCK
ncbi:MAG: hypothetical protein Q7U57_18230 [Methylovulum sp.]|nr:hypothetical protein [Methylovulum sp.]